MALLFGQFLVKVALITADQLLDALVHQLQSIPSTAELIYAHNLLPKADQLRVLAHQQIHGMDHRASARDLGLWNDVLETRIGQEYQKVRRPLGEVLVASGYLKQDSLSVALNEYIEMCTNQQQNSRENENEAILVAQHMAASDHTTEELEPSLCNEYVENVFDKIFPAISVMIKNLAEITKDDAPLSKLDALPEFMQKLYVEVAALRAAADFLQAPRSLQLATEMLETISLFKSMTKPTKLNEFSEYLNLWMQVVGGIGYYIQEFHSEEGMVSDINLNDLWRRGSQLQSRLRSAFATIKAG